MAKPRFRLVRRNNGVFYCVDRKTLIKVSLDTNDPETAQRLLDAKNEAERVPEINHQIAVAYLSATDPAMAKRTWNDVFDAYAKKVELAGRRGLSPTLDRCRRAIGDKAFDLIRRKKLISTNGQDFLNVLDCGTVSTNVFLRRFHNFALDMNWLPKAVMGKRTWPRVVHRRRRGITPGEHALIIANEVNPERKHYYELLWETGAAQGDAAKLCAEDIDWNKKILSFQRAKRMSSGDGFCVIRIGATMERILRARPAKGLLFPYLASVRSGDRSTEFHQRCEQLKIKGVTLHCYRKSWAKRAKEAGYPERFAMSQLGHGSRDVHEVYARDAQVICPSLEEYEQKQSEGTIVEFKVA